MMKKTLVCSVIAFTLASALPVFSEVAFSGYFGGKLNYSSSSTTAYDPNLKLQAFFQGQLNLSSNIWGHIEFSLDTEDLTTEKLFDKTESKFTVDEISMTFRAPLDSSANYFSAFMGTYDPIGSDIFLQRYFGVQSFASKITESWLGLSGSVLYPHFGVGISDVIKSAARPAAGGAYLYINHEDDNYFVLNADLRFATVYRYFTFDVAGGIGIPLADNYKGTEVFIAVDTIYWHAGTSVLIGNNYTNSLFLQAGLFNAPFTKKNGKIIINPNDLYILIEPRFLVNNMHLNISIFSLPQNTVDQLLFVKNTLGIDVNAYSDSITLGQKRFSIGAHLAVSFQDMNIMTLNELGSCFPSKTAITLTPYIATNLYKGELHAQLTVNVLGFASTSWYNAISADLGYKVKI